VQSRRQFLLDSVVAASATWIGAHWPAALAAAQHAHNAAQQARPSAKSSAAPKFDFFTPKLAAEIESITARIIPSDETPGAREAGVVYFIDRALVTFAKNDQKLYTAGITEVQALVRKMFPGIERFSAASETQQDEVIATLDQSGIYGRRPFVDRPIGQTFFETLRQHTIAGFLIDPASERRGNRDGVGWALIGREREHMFQPPFGHYDKDYPGWQIVAENGGTK